jgi:hypothetical protein
MSHHDCDNYIPLKSVKGTRYTCVCGNVYQCTRSTFGGLFQKWEKVEVKDERHKGL